MFLLILFYVVDVFCVLRLSCSMCSIFVLCVLGLFCSVCSTRGLFSVFYVWFVLCVLYLVCSMWSMFVLSDMRGRGVEVCTCQAVDFVH